MAENETTQPQTDAEIPEVQLSEGELEEVAGGSIYIPYVSEWIEAKVEEITGGHN